MPVWNESCLRKPGADAQHALAGLLIHPENCFRRHWLSWMVLDPNRAGLLNYPS